MVFEKRLKLKSMKILDVYIYLQHFLLRFTYLEHLVVLLYKIGIIIIVIFF